MTGYASDQRLKVRDPQRPANSRLTFYVFGDVVFVAFDWNACYCHRSCERRRTWPHAESTHCVVVSVILSRFWVPSLMVHNTYDPTCDVCDVRAIVSHADVANDYEYRHILWMFEILLILNFTTTHRVLTEKSCIDALYASLFLNCQHLLA